MPLYHSTTAAASGRIVQVGGGPDIQSVGLGRKNVVVVGSSREYPTRELDEESNPASPGKREFLHEMVRQGIDIRGHLDGKESARGDVAEEPGKKLAVAGDPPERGVRENNIEGRARSPGGNVGIHPLNTGMVGSGAIRHLGGVVDADDLCVRPPIPQFSGAMPGPQPRSAMVAGASRQIRRTRSDTARLSTLGLETEVLLGIPCHNRIMDLQMPIGECRFPIRARPYHGLALPWQERAGLRLRAPSTPVSFRRNQTTCPSRKSPCSNYTAIQNLRLAGFFDLQRYAIPATFA